MENITLTRDQLYDLIWSKPTSVLAKEFGLSDNGLRKICKNHNIPLPYLGYWSKLRFGKPARKVNLSTKFNGKDEIIISPSTELTESNQKEISARTILIKEIESKYKNLLKVPARLTNPDALIVKAKDALTINKHYYSRNGLIRIHSGYININVDPINVPRALRFMDTLIKLLKARGYKITIGDESRVEVLGEQLVIRLQEKLRFETIKEGSYNRETRYYYPTGIFMLRTWKTFHWHQRVWTDGKVLIEDQLAKILVGIELLAERERKERLEIEEFWRVQKEKERIEKERHDREELDGANFQKLLAQSKLWKQSQILNEYIAEIESKLIADCELTDKSKEWLGWAKEKAEKFNPLNDLSF